MIAFKRRLGFKQYMPLKPVKRGIKVWAAADAVSGYMSGFNVYTGKDDGPSGTGLGLRVVQKLAEPYYGKNQCFAATFLPA